MREIPQEARQGNAYSGVSTRRIRPLPFSCSTVVLISPYGCSRSAIAGCDSSCIEQLLLRRKVMGPCWLRIEGASPNTQSFSWCKAEFNASGIKGITVSDEHRNTGANETDLMRCSGSSIAISVAKTLKPLLPLSSRSASAAARYVDQPQDCLQ
eukprot:SAG11_NODE_802_length_7105_cov_1.831573_3_plen_154_part_00